MIRLAHLSDLHYTTARRPNVRATLETVRHSGSDHLIITGDLTDDGSDVQMRGLLSLLKFFGYDNRQTLTVIPGNHDLYGFIYQTFNSPHGVVGQVQGVRSLLATARTLWEFRRRLVTYSALEYERAVAKFTAHFSFAFDDCIRFGNARSGFPFVKLLPDNLALIGVDSNFHLPRIFGTAKIVANARRVIRTHDICLLGENLSGSTGWVDIEALDVALSRPDVRRRKKIVLIHHCLYDLPCLIARTSRPYAMEMRLANRDQVAQLLDRHRVDLVLHGHEHRTETYLLEGGSRVLNGGGAYSNQFRCIDVSSQTGQMSISTTRHGESQASHDSEVFQP